MNIFKWLLMVVGAMFLAGCQEEAPVAKHQGYIAQVEDNQILVGDIFFSIDDAKLKTDKGKSLTSTDLRVGMQVNIHYDGVVAESYPMQARADKVIIGTHKDNLKSEEAIRAIVQYAEKQYGKPIIIQNSDTIDDSLFRLEIKVFTEDEPLYLQYNFDTKTVSLD
jgi:hypothetical protein